MDVDILDDNHTVCDSIGVISSDPYTHLMKECGKPQETPTEETWNNDARRQRAFQMRFV
jgi:hypothetical protein